MVKNDCYFGIQREDSGLIEVIKKHIDGKLRDHVRNQYCEVHGDASSRLAPFSVD
jgi:hypothetical protein